MQYFKGDSLELKIDNAAALALSIAGQEIDTMEAEVFECYKLGEMLYDNAWMPLVNAISRQIFSQAFAQIFEAWSKCGTFESYISVFKKIFGEDANLTFTVPGPGQLQISVESTGEENFLFIARTVVGNTWVYDYVVDELSHNILFYTVLGIESQYELEKVLFSLAPNGIFTEIGLTFV